MKTLYEKDEKVNTPDGPGDVTADQQEGDLVSVYLDNICEVREYSADALGRIISDGGFKKMPWELALKTIEDQKGMPGFK